ncbi:hypothetical protein JMN32_13905 [Fulvivirga sp. 29W222]|uniref:YCII-related domain-containing protein n=1 Tax=Fulvivirga marina TaxID=2494733 RepID=A0A937KCD6_9BACT|nr:YciI family protein [Fulvivirga marina]MBL6447407.1 hypothetical protein [Fulvivirga marina]
MNKLILLLALITWVWNAHAQEKYMFVFLHSNPEKEVLSEQAMDSLQKGHMANIQRLSSEDKLLVAGPFEGGGGIFILNTNSISEAREWINTDPAIKAHRYRIEILPWTPRSGGICKVSEDTKMVFYTFIRYQSHITKFNVQQAPEWFLKHDRYSHEIVKTGNVISEGVFDNDDGSILIMKGEVEPEVIMSDPAVKNGILQPELKTIWVGKGSFCEN